MPRVPCVIAFDLGTSGAKAALYGSDGVPLAVSFEPYQTFYTAQGWHEQRPADWWQAVVRGTRALASQTSLERLEIIGCALSGHSLGVVPLDGQGRLLREQLPIWSDARATAQARRFFSAIGEDRWYDTTGNGFPPALYTLFKIMWYQEHEPDAVSRADRIIGTKDFINYKLTGSLATDHSYASGCGAYDLRRWRYAEDFIAAAGVPQRLFPEIVPSTQSLGQLTHEAAGELGLPQAVKVLAGGVDNSCMALGAGNLAEGDVYNSLGSSSWIAVCSREPLLDRRVRPFVFAHVLPGLSNSAVSIFSAGTTFRWLRDQFCRDLIQQAEKDNLDIYELMCAQAAQSPPGANGLLFDPTLGGGSGTDGAPRRRGAIFGLELRHTRADVIRAAMEGIALSLRAALDELKRLRPLGERMMMVGGGARSPLWRQIFADVYGMRIEAAASGQHTASLGAAAVAALGSGLWSDLAPLRCALHTESSATPEKARQPLYNEMLRSFKRQSKLPHTRTSGATGLIMKHDQREGRANG